MQVHIDPAVEARMRSHALAALPAEACGLVGGTVSTAPATTRLSHYEPLANTARCATRFALDPVAVATVECALRSSGLALCAVFHSHPDTPPTPSASDRQAAWPELLQLILAVETRQRRTGALRIWRCRDGSIERVARSHEASARLRSRTRWRG